MVKFRGNRVGVEKIKKANKNTNPLFVEPDAADSVGIVRYVGDTVGSDIKVGQKVYYGDKIHNVRLGGAELVVMEDSNVLALVEE